MNKIKMERGSSPLSILNEPNSVFLTDVYINVIFMKFFHLFRYFVTNLCFSQNRKKLQPQFAPARTQTAFSSRLVGFKQKKRMAPAR